MHAALPVAREESLRVERRAGGPQLADSAQQYRELRLTAIRPAHGRNHRVLAGGDAGPFRDRVRGEALARPDLEQNPIRLFEQLRQPVLKANRA